MGTGEEELCHPASHLTVATPTSPPLPGVDTAEVNKESSDYRPGFMQHFDKKEEQNKRRKQPLQGPQNISYYFPSVPEGMEFKDYVSSVWKG